MKEKTDLENSTETLETEGEPERGYWGSPAEFILSCLGYAVGLGNVWRFPYLCYVNGGGAFLIPYFLMLTFVGIPVFLIELTVGQYSASGPATVWEAAPLFRGVGFGMLVISFIGSIYYNLIIAWSLYYFVATFQSVLPWQGCDNDYNTENCYSKREALPCEELNGTWFNQTCYNETYVSTFDVPVFPCNVTVGNMTNENGTCIENDLADWLTNQTESRAFPSEEYFRFQMLHDSGSMDETGSTSWQLVVALLVAWIMCYLCILKGIRSSGKVVYFTATFPYLLLIILLVRAVLLDGAWTGIKFYLTPTWENLSKPKVWADAAGQIFFSLSAGTGGLMTFASYNKFHNNIYRDTLIVAIGNCLTSFFAGFAIFSIIGFMAETLEQPVAEATATGPGLAFVAYPEVVTWLPLPQLWAALFFFMLVTLGLDSQFAGLENIQTAITDSWPHLRRYKWAVSGVLCTSMFLLGLTQCTQAGLYWTEVMSYYSSGWALVLMGTVEGMVFPWVYGASRLLDDIEAMVGFRLYKHWWVVWVIISPILLIVILIVNFIDFSPAAVGDYELPDWAQGLGWGIALMSIVGIPIFAAIEIWKSYQNPERQHFGFIQHVRILCKPSDKWMSQPEKRKAAGHVLPPKANQVMDYGNPAFVETHDAKDRL